MKKQSVEQRAEELLQPIVDDQGFELVDVEYVKEGGTWYLRAYVDKEGGITVDDCEAVSRPFEEALDAENLIGEAYVLEVSSPGLTRPLKKEKDYVRAKGREVEIRTFSKIDGEKEHLGVLTSWDEETVNLTDEEGKEHQFAKSDIAMIRLAFHF